MPTYISLARYTQQGLGNIKESPARIDAARKAFKRIGVTLKTFYSVSGAYDVILVCEADNGAAMAKAALLLGSHGNVRSETLHALTEVEFRKVVAGLP